MIITAMNEGGNETRVAITPNVVKNYIKLGFEVLCEQDAGKRAGFANEDYQQAGATILKDRKTLLQETSILLCVEEPSPSDLKGLPTETLLIGQINNNSSSHLLLWCLKHRISVFSMNHIPRLNRTQSMDSLTSQANLAGYRATLEAVTHFNRAVPKMMTPVGMNYPATVLVLGTGAAGLQAIATAKRLGANVYAFDTCSETKKEVEDLGAQLLEVHQTTAAKTTSSYLSDPHEEYDRLQTELIDKHACLADIIICSVLASGTKAPILLKESTVSRMKAGSVIVDLATAQGGNCELSECDQIIKYKQITIIGYSNLAGFIPMTASELYSKNLLYSVELFSKSIEKITFNDKDVIIREAMLCHDGQYLPFNFSQTYSKHQYLR